MIFTVPESPLWFGKMLLASLVDLFCQYFAIFSYCFCAVFMLALASIQKKSNVRTELKNGQAETVSSNGVWRREGHGGHLGVKPIVLANPRSGHPETDTAVKMRLRLRRPAFYHWSVKRDKGS